ncbi:glycosyltransferase family 2 protein [Paenibacillus sp. MMS20-IR301]|uniref:glycosyltransferase n=1 Tax=Paenibacillus sp. MMS20-IR301 TaxID=2895946 RepID=UPI0028EF597B|nr:glycosyltransferase family 2 protein [Paenibacillus sp. MMS20-IR301]WNS42608.1 glycosyltransferase family 2 protein [Paenibacillus sp. MMS20-IR301]
MIIVLQIITGMLLLQLLFALWNAAQLPKLGAGADQSVPEALPVKAAPEGRRLSVLIPARNEAHNIANCLSSVLACSKGGIGPEIIVLDDSSSDGTGAVAAAAGGVRVQVLQGQELPEGWLGKSHACAQLAKAAEGEWLLFLDADVRLQPPALQAALSTAYAQGGGMVTGFPRQDTGTWLERLVVPLMVFTVICHLPVPLVRGSRDPRFVAAHGGFILIHRDCYARCGGHEAIRSELVDDMALARAVKRAGEPVCLADITDYVRVRMYRSAGEVWNGYRKNIYAGTGRSPLLLLAVLIMYFLFYLLPPAAVLYYCLTGQPGAALLPAAAVLTGIAIKRISDAAGRQPVWFCFLLPAGIFCLSLIAAASWRGSGSRRGYEWKGRRYS